MAGGEMRHTPQTPDERVLNTKLTDLFVYQLPDGTIVPDATLTHALGLLQIFFDPKGQYVYNKGQRDKNLTVGDILKFKIIKGKYDRWWSYNKETGQAQAIVNMGNVSLSLIQQHLKPTGYQIKVEDDKTYFPDF